MTLAAARKAFVPVVLGAIAVVSEAIGIKLPGDTAQQIAAAVVTAVFVYLVPNG